MRALILVPIVHSEAELGTMADVLRRQFEERYGPQQWALREPSIHAMWEGIRRRLFELPIAWKHARVYQDGLPVCGHEMDIVREVAAKGSQNYALLLELVERGATLMGTEEPTLMVREYRRIQELVRIFGREVPEAEVLALKREGEELLRERDAFIARRIESTLADKETGIIFLGLLHRVDERLGYDFHVQHLIHNLPFRADTLRRLEEERDRE